MLILNSPEVVQETAMRWRREHKLALVTTMGALHDGHLKLVQRAKELGQKCLVTIFVNPLQFGPKEDFTKYPRTLEEDKEKLEALDVDLLFTPSAKELYPEGFASRVTLSGLTEHMEGKSRPGHFEGVATVCLKLFMITQADYAIFGEKDFQQLRVLQQMTADLNLPLAIVAHPTVRESDGLALSSRNRFLSAEERGWATRIPETMKALRELTRTQPTVTIGELLESARASLTKSPLVVDYAQIAPEATLVPASPETRFSEIAGPRLFLAARAGNTRLIDNGSLEGWDG